MKALILAGGKGTRLHPLTETLPKQLIPVANKPVLFYVLEQVSAAGITEAGIITSPESYPQIWEALKETPAVGLSITFIIQEKPAGLAHAVKTAAGFLGESDFLMLLGDNLLHPPVAFLLEEFKKSHADALVLLKKVENPSEYGVAVLDERGLIKQLMEKPKDPPTNLAVLGVYFFRGIIQEAIERIRPSRRGELEITDAVQELINMGGAVKAHIFQGWWIDTGKKDDLLEANRTILNKWGQFRLEGTLDEHSVISGVVEIGKASLIESSVIRGPVIIGTGCSIKNSVVGPYSSIGKNSIINNCVVKDTIMLPSCSLAGVNIEKSLIGYNTGISALGAPGGEFSLLIGNNCDIWL
ncbi:MAG: glucose-1-phosphate thymidylyltransferase [Desulfocucumaceae bacterium]